MPLRKSFGYIIFFPISHNMKLTYAWNLPFCCATPSYCVALNINNTLLWFLFCQVQVKKMKVLLMTAENDIQKMICYTKYYPRFVSRSVISCPCCPSPEAVVRRFIRKSGTQTKRHSDVAMTDKIKELFRCVSVTAPSSR